MSLPMAVDNRETHSLQKLSWDPEGMKMEIAPQRGHFPCAEVFLFPSKYFCTTISEPGHSRVLPAGRVRGTRGRWRGFDDSECYQAHVIWANH